MKGIDLCGPPPYLPSMTRKVTVDEYVRFREEGFLIVRGLVDEDDVRELIDHVE